MRLPSLRQSSAAVLAGLALVACGGGTSSTKSNAPPKVKKEGPIVAKVGDDSITADEVKKKLGEQSPFLQARYRDLNHRKEFVQNLVRFEVLAQEAYRKGLDKDPEVQATIKKVLVQELIRQSFDEKQANYSDEQLKAYYDKHIDEFVKPERVRAAHIFLAAPAADKAARAKAKTKASELLAKLKANDAVAAPGHPKHASHSPTLFAELARENSEDAASKPNGGDLRYMSQDELGKAHGESLAAAVFGLKNPNDLTAVVETEKGVHIARLTNRQLSVNRTFEDTGVKDTIKGRLFREERTKSFDGFVEQLKKDANVTIDETVLGAIEVPNAGAAPAGMPPAQMPKLNPPPVPPVANTNPQ